MSSKNFTTIAKRYKASSIVQSSASDILFDLLDIQPNECVLDVGCGTGNLTKRIYDLSKGKVIGIDPSQGMINECQHSYNNAGISFNVMKAEEIGYENEFDVIFCNSTFQWIQDIDTSIKNFHRALKKRGRFGMQAPGKNIYCPNFIKAVNEVVNNQKTRKWFKNFNSPWFFLNTSQEYAEYFERNNFHVSFNQIQTIETLHTPEETYKIFASGAIAGYLNKEFYTGGFTDEYSNDFQEIIKESFADQAIHDGKVKLIFNRIFLIAEK